MCVH